MQFSLKNVYNYKPPAIKNRYMHIFPLTTVQHKIGFTAEKIHYFP